MDLGDFFGGVIDLGSAYINAKMAPQQTWNPATGFVAPPTFLGNNPILTNDLVAPAAMISPGGPGVAPSSSCGASPVWKKVCGTYKWVVPKRRRRRQLITQSDAAGLAKLKGIVGQGKTMEVWIATHSRG